jgi:hypothetical protein
MLGLAIHSTPANHGPDEEQSFLEPAETIKRVTKECGKRPQDSDLAIEIHEHFPARDIAQMRRINRRCCQCASRIDGMKAVIKVFNRSAIVEAMNRMAPRTQIARRYRPGNAAMGHGKA